MKDTSSIFVDDFVIKSLPLRFRIAALLSLIGLGADMPWLSANVKEILFLRGAMIVGALSCSFVCKFFSTRKSVEVLIVLSALGEVLCMALLGTLEGTYLSGYTAAVYQTLAFIVIFMPLRTGVFVGLVVLTGILWFYIFPTVLPVEIEQRLFVSHIFGYITYALMSLAGNYLFFQVWAEKQNQWLSMEEKGLKLKEMAYCDGLTGVYNFRHFTEKFSALVEESKRESTPITLCLIDLNDFKLINDRYGHLMGNEVLKNVAQSLVSSTRSQDLIFRIGGDEFAVVLPGVNSNYAQAIIEHVKENLISSGLPGIDDEISCSIGIAELSPQLPTPDAIMETADRSLYKAKELKNADRKI
ncbi:MAG: GGDEF domain-containing protein [Bacillota bacterium]